MPRCAAKPIVTSLIDGLDAPICSSSRNTYPCLPLSPYSLMASEARYLLNPIKTSPTIYTRAAQNLNVGRKRYLFLSSRSST